jgi:hypothetical protein
LIPPRKQSMEHSEIRAKIIRKQFQKLRRAKPKEIKSQLKKHNPNYSNKKK